MDWTREARYQKNTALSKEAELLAEKILKPLHKKLRRNGYEQKHQAKAYVFWKEMGMESEAIRIQNAPDFHVPGEGIYYEVKRGISIAKDSYQECMRLHKVGNIVWLMVFREKWYKGEELINNVFLIAPIQSVKFTPLDANHVCPNDGVWYQPTKLSPAKLQKWLQTNGSANDFRYLNISTKNWKVITT